MLRKIIQLIIVSLGLMLSVYLYGVQMETAPGACFAGGCETVLTSDVAKIFGQPVALYGIIYFLVLALTYVFDFFATRDKQLQRSLRLLRLVLFTGGIGFLSYLRYLEFFVIYEICGWCWLVMFTVLILAGIYAVSERIWLLSNLYRRLLKPVLFKFDPERVHNFFIASGRLIGRCPLPRLLLRKFFQHKHPALKQEIAGVSFESPVGLSAGFDKDAQLGNVLGQIGFGFAELGSVTKGSYPGNTGKRLVRLPELKSIAVYFGLKSSGVDKFLTNLEAARHRILPAMASVARTNGTCESTVEEAVADYLFTFIKVAASPAVEMISINISCPNATTGEIFTMPDNLPKLLSPLADAREKLGIKKPIFIKLPLAKSWEDIDKLLQIIVEYKFTGVIISNLQKDRSQLADIKGNQFVVSAEINGGLSGLPTQKLGDEYIFRTYAKYRQKLKIIGVGGIFSAADAYRKIKNGATLVGLITGMIYQGPQLISEINRGLIELLQGDGYENIAQAIGAAHKIR